MLGTQSVKSLRAVRLFVTPWMQHTRLPCPSPTPRVHPNPCPLSQWCHPTISSSVIAFSCLQSSLASGSFPISQFFASGAQVLEFQLHHQSFQEYSGLISFRIDWFGLLAAQETLKGLLQHHSSKASILQRSAVFIVQLSHPYMTTGKTIALTRWTFVSKVMSLPFNMLSRLVKAFLLCGGQKNKDNETRNKKLAETLILNVKICP